MRQALGGNVRLTVEAIRGSRENARLVQDRLRTIPGVLEVTADPSTGGVVIAYDPGAIAGGRSDAHAVARVPRREPIPRGTGATWLVVRLAEVVTVVLFEMALQRVLGPWLLFRRC
jgi:hypothetical protein